MTLLSVAGLRLLTNADTVAQLWLESSQDQYMQSQWKQNVPKSCVYFTMDMFFISQIEESDSNHQYVNQIQKVVEDSDAE